MPVPYLSYPPPTCHTRPHLSYPPPPVIPVPHLSYPSPICHTRPPPVIPAPHLSYPPPTCHTRPPPVIPAPHLSYPPPSVIPVPHLSFPQGFSGNPESFMLENLNGGGSMQPLPRHSPSRGALQNSLSLSFPRSLAPPLVIGERESRRRGWLSPDIPRQGNGRGFLLGARVLFAPAGRFWKTSVDSRLNLRE